MKTMIRFAVSTLVIAVLAIPGSVLGQTANLQFVATINAGAGTGGLDQLQVDVQMDTDIAFDLGNSTIQFTYNDAAMAVPSGAVGNDPLVEGTDFDWIAPFDTGFMVTYWYTSTATLFGTTDRPSLNITTVDDGWGSTIASGNWTTIARFYFDITDGAQTAQLVWIPGTDPNPIVINTDVPTAVANGTFTDNDADLDAGLPVELVDFAATVDGGDIAITWSTASESSNAGFAIEYAASGSDDWTEIGYVEGVGNSNKLKVYSFRTASVGFGTFQFRLRQIDASGGYQYSDRIEVAIDVPDSYILSTPYPNPFNPSASFTLALREQQNVRVELYNMLGQMMEVLHSGVLGADETHSFEIDGSRLSSGMYLVRVVGDNFSTTKTATLLK